MSLSVTPEAAIVQGMGAGVVPVAVTEAAIRAVVYIDTRYTHTHTISSGIGGSSA